MTVQSLLIPCPQDSGSPALLQLGCGSGSRLPQIKRLFQEDKSRGSVQWASILTAWKLAVGTAFGG